MLFDYMKEALTDYVREIEHPIDLVSICRRAPVIHAPKGAVFVRVIIPETATKTAVVTLRLNAEHTSQGARYRAAVDKFTSVKIWVTTNFLSDVFAYWDEWKHKSVKPASQPFDYDQIVETARRALGVFTKAAEIDFKHTPCVVLKSRSGEERRYVFQRNVTRLFTEYNEDAITITDKHFPGLDLRSRKISWASRLESESAEWNTRDLVAVLEGLQ